MAATQPILRGAAALGLVLDAWVHAYLAGRYDGVTASISEGNLFRAEAAAASLAALLVLVWRKPAGDVFAWVTAAAGLAALLVYRYVDIGAFGPLPNMYDPFWYADKYRAVAGQCLAVLALTPLILGHFRERASKA
jgi:hypothetical protein